jgi:predicted type IV restriction endonuclease
MDFDKIHDIASRIPDKIGKIKNEDQAKMAFVLPFIGALGYEFQDPNDVLAEYAIDEGGKKNEYIDYVLLKDGEPIILIECKWNGGFGSELNNKEYYSQLKKYFNMSPAKFGILTNGIIYKFYSDLDEPNKMDKTPFLVLDLQNIRLPIKNDLIVAEIANFSKPIDKDEAYDRAKELKYMRELRMQIEAEFTAPSEEFTKFFASRVYKKGHLVKNVVDQFSIYTKKTCDQFIQDKIDDFVKAAKNTANGMILQPSNDTSDTEQPDVPKIKSYKFEGKEFEVKFWKEMLPNVCAIMASRHKERVEELFSVKGDIYPYFSRNQQELKSPELIEGTDIYVATSYAKGMLLKIAKDVVTLFGYPEDIVSYGESQD